MRNCESLTFLWKDGRGAIGPLAIICRAAKNQFKLTRVMDRGDEGSRPEDDPWLSGVHLVVLLSVNAVFVLSGSLPRIESVSATTPRRKQTYCRSAASPVPGRQQLDCGGEHSAPFARPPPRLQSKPRLR